MIREAIDMLVTGRSLAQEEAAAVMEEIMTGEATQAQIGSFLTALRMKGETVDEIAGMAQVMRSKALRVEFDGPTVDTCGTGGDGSGTFNISTAAAFVVAGAGLTVAKHGNRAASSQCGSADVLEASGVKIELTPEQVKACLEQVGIGFMFAQSFHPAMRFVGGVRREIGIRTIFNILGPLTNPAGATRQVLGVGSDSLLLKMAESLQRLGSRHAMVVWGADGMDEISISGPTRVHYLRDMQIEYRTIHPQDFGLPVAPRSAILGGTPAENAVVLRDVLSGAPGAIHDMVVLNAAAALVVGDAVKDMIEGVALAKESITSGRAIRKLSSLIQITQSFAS
ncbi:MAG: anthranilate phosphoribosyltransferase [Chloroflexi bacterium]|nr:anthranilate phosphoribosyltransferase [Chloroflexota bacterium]